MTKMKFDINNYHGSSYAIHCNDKEEFDEFLDYLYNNGYDHLAPTFQRHLCYGDNVYYFNNDTWSDKEYAIKMNYKLLEWSDFNNKEFTKADLKTGDVVRLRNGDVEIVIRTLEMLIHKTEYNNLDNYIDDLTNVYDKKLDIMEVRRPTTKGDCRFTAFKYNCGTLIYERKEVEEMTLEQVCKLLGKEIKIIK